ncbi:hypothetical protein HO173_003208 [Letharia columbiana]|uniref:Uncharacterized protein n=1 Tax=Letharia columbiana TaxID=112416 RepID=A0A8H6G1H9_9LECA|nr:uncharacterized protein HO173_003208 [Letharia columbiana]KAF6238702.1 hypothetical protein HO173_003208 [Letharia columbiana]
MPPSTKSPSTPPCAARPPRSLHPPSTLAAKSSPSSVLGTSKNLLERMRYSRFKQQMEGVAPAPPTARAAKEEHQGTVFKAEKEENMDAMSGVEQTVKEEHFVKPEPEIKAEC